VQTERQPHIISSSFVISTVSCSISCRVTQKIEYLLFNQLYSEVKRGSSSFNKTCY